MYQSSNTTTVIKLGQIKKGSPLDKKEYGFRILISRGIGGLRWVKVTERKRYYDDWWNGKKSGNPDLELAPSKELYQAFIKSKTITWSEYVRRFTDEIMNNPKAQKALEILSNYNGTVTLLCHCLPPIIPREFAREYGLDEPSHVVIEGRPEGILIRKLEV